MGVLEQAIAFAAEAHAGTCRKGTSVPYIVHPMEAAAIAASMTADHSVIAAAVLHDVTEDTNFSVEDIRARFGDRIASLVAAESENKREKLPAEATWSIRKQETIAHLQSTASIEVKMIALGDKLSNIRAIYRDQLAIGDALWERFHQKDKAQHKWYYSAIADALSELKVHPAWQEYHELVQKVFGE